MRNFLALLGALLLAIIFAAPRRIGRLVVGVFLIVAFVPLAFAADGASLPLSSFLDPIMAVLGSLVAALIAAFVAWLWGMLSRQFGVNLDAKYREALQTALQNAAGLALQKLRTAASGVQVPLSRPEIAEAVGYVLKSVPDAIEHFGLDEDAIGEKILAKIGLAKSGS